MYLLDLAGMGWTGNSLDSFAAILCYVWLSPGEGTWKHYEALHDLITQLWDSWL
jgi:hypothetical protein